jgi:CRISPR system Cascade subunit CasC
MKGEDPMFVELHMIQNFSPSNLNRDDLNNPKECEFGGVRRARISSQCIKRAIRDHELFEETTGVDNGKRTKWMIDLLSEPLQDEKSEEEAEAVAASFAATYAKKMDSKNEAKTKVLVYMSPDEVEYIVAALLAKWDEVLPEAKGASKVIRGIVKDTIKKYEAITSAPDIALFGRMLADRPDTNLDAACQVAHAISTHAVKMEMDFYTAVDDLQPDEETGAGMMGYTGFNSACFYRYARIDWDQLVKNLNHDSDLAARTVEGFLRAAVEAVPSGKQNAFAAYNPPGFLLAVVRENGMGWSLSNAFERPVQSRHSEGLVTPSVKKLDTYWGNLCRVYGTEALTCYTALAPDPDLPLEHLKETQVKSLEEWIGLIVTALPAGEEAS